MMARVSVVVAMLGLVALGSAQGRSDPRMPISFCAAPAVIHWMVLAILPAAFPISGAWSAPLPVKDGRTYLMHVPGVIGASLSDAEIAAVLNYIMEKWAGTSLPGDFKPFDGEEVARLRAEPIGDVVSFRRQLVQGMTAKGIATADYPWP